MTGTGIQDWSTTASSNGSADTNINYSEGQSPASINDSARAMMAALKAFYAAIAGGVTYGGSSNAYTITNASPGAWSAYAAPQIIALKANHTNTGAATVNVDALGAKTIKTNDGGDVASGDIVSGGIYLLAYDGTYFQILNTIAGGAYQPLDGTLTALAAYGWSSGTEIITWTAADTITVADAATFVRTTGTQTIGGAKTFTGTFGVSANYAGFYITDTAAAADSQVWRYLGGGNGTIYFQALTDDLMSASTPFSIARTGTTIDTFAIAGVAITLTGEVGITGNATVSGSLQARIPLSSETSALTTASANKKILASGDITVPASVFTAHDTVLIDGNGTARTITRGSGLTMYVNGTDSATATLTANGLMAVNFRSATVCVLTGNVS